MSLCMVGIAKVLFQDCWRESNHTSVGDNTNPAMRDLTEVFASWLIALFQISFQDFFVDLADKLFSEAQNYE